MQMTMLHKVCMVTGATSGMGKATAAALAQMGATVVLVARNRSKGEAVRDEIRQQSGNTNVEVLYADLSSLQAVRELATTFQQQYQQLHVLINNAGGIFFKREATADGLETTLVVNHLAPFLLTCLLLDTLKANAPARVINISSNVERIGNINFADLQGKKRYISFLAYSQAKLAMMLFTYELARRCEGTGVTVNAVTPGPVATGFGKGGNSFMNRVLPFFFRFATSAEEGAQTAIYLASSPTVERVTGKAFYHSKEQSSSRKSYSIALQKRVWQVSQKLTNVAG
ncbi:MAG TPA: SDR family oxidoreductase [Ktedonobacteraceae bacterium]|nr:SDR family oxidoreductase [Ktedonobacteraceae bacterium]